MSSVISENRVQKYKFYLRADNIVFAEVVMFGFSPGEAVVNSKY